MAIAFRRGNSWPLSGGRVWGWVLMNIRHAVGLAFPDSVAVENLAA